MSNSRFDKRCILCSTEYKYCQNCDRFSSLPRWMESFDNDNCHTIFNTIMEYKAGAKTLDQAAAILRKCDYSYRDKIKQTNENMDGYITAILAENKKEETKIETPIETINVVEDVPTEESIKVEEKIEEQKSEKKSYYNKKNYKK